MPYNIIWQTSGHLDVQYIIVIMIVIIIVITIADFSFVLMVVDIYSKPQNWT